MSPKTPRTYSRKIRGHYSALHSGNATPPTSPESQTNGKEVVKKTLPSLRDAADKMVNVSVLDSNGNQKLFIFHKSFICHHSPYYSAAFNGRFSEAQSQSIVYYAISLEAFGRFADWIYNQKIENGEGEMPSTKDLIDLWILADSILIPCLQNQCIEALNDQCAKRDEIPTELFLHVYENTTEPSPLRKFLVDLCASQLGKMEFGDEMPREMLVDILKASGELKTTKAAKFTKEKMKRYLVDDLFVDCR